MTLAPKVSVSLAIFATCTAAAIAIANVNGRLKGLDWAIIPLFVLAGVALLYAVITAFFKKSQDEESKPEIPVDDPLKQRTIRVANDLFTLLREQGPKPPNPLSGKGGEEEQRRVFNDYFAWVKALYFKYVAYHKDRVVQIDNELAAHGVFTKLYPREIDPPPDTQEVDVKKIAEALLLAASQMPDAGTEKGPSV